MKKIALLFCLSLMIASCKQANPEAKTDVSSIYDLPSWAQNATLYEVNLRQFTDEGTIAAFENHLPRIKEMGVDIIWFMPIFPISETKRKGGLGSYYAVSDFKDINPEHGTLEDFKSLTNKIHDLGMYVILDFVPNHTGWDNQWIKDNPEWYTQDSAGNVIDPVDPGTGKSWGWTDVADLNYDNPEMRKAMIESFLFWINEVDVDGFRMDVAHNVPQDFWDDAAKELHAAKDIFMLAESEVHSHRNSKAFHADYGWGFHHLLNEVARSEKGAKDIIAKVVESQENYQEGFHLHFTSNHDENTWAGTVFDRMGDAHKALAVITATIQGMPLLYSGQEEPMTKRLRFFEKDTIGFSEYAYADFYQKLFELKHKNKALWNGKYGDDSPEFFQNDENILAFKRAKANDEVMVVVNLNPEQVNYEVASDFIGTDIFSGTKMNIKQGDILTLSAYGYKVLSNN